MRLGSAGSHKKINLRKKRIMKIGLLEHEIHPIKVQKLLTFVLNYKDQYIVSEHITWWSKFQIKFRELWVNICFTDIRFPEIDDYTSLQNAGDGLVCLRTCEIYSKLKTLKFQTKRCFSSKNYLRSVAYVFLNVCINYKSNPINSGI